MMGQVKTAQRYSSRTPTKVYELYPYLSGFSVKRVDYHGIAMSVAATSVSQAYAVAHKNVWIDPEHKYRSALCRSTTPTPAPPPYGAAARGTPSQADSPATVPGYGHYGQPLTLTIAFR